VIGSQYIRKKSIGIEVSCLLFATWSFQQTGKPPHVARKHRLGFFYVLVFRPDIEKLFVDPTTRAAISDFNLANG